MNEDKEKCRLCSGSGEHFYDLCPICGGAGYVDWIEQIVGCKDTKFKTIEAKRIADNALRQLREASFVIQRQLDTETTPNRSAMEEFIRIKMREANLGDLCVGAYVSDAERALELRVEFNLLDERYGVSVLCPMI